MQDTLAQAQQDQSLDYLREKEEGAYAKYPCAIDNCKNERVWGRHYCESHWEYENDVY